MPDFKLTGTDKQDNEPDNDTPESLHFPDYTPWGEHHDPETSPADILDTLEDKIERAQNALDQLAEDADVLFRFDASTDNDDDSPAAA